MAKNKKDNSRRKRICSMLALAVILILISAAFAYLTDSDQKDNIFEVGEADIEIIEPSWDDATDTDADNVPDFAEHMVANKKIAKDPYVENEGNVPLWIFASVTVPTSDQPYHNASLQTVNEPGTFYDLINLRYNNVAGINSDDWVLLYTENTDRTEIVTPGVSETCTTYYYGYKTVVPAGESTSELFDEIQLQNITSGTLELTRHTIPVKAYGIQSEDIEASTVQEAWGIFGVIKEILPPVNP